MCLTFVCIPAIVASLITLPRTPAADPSQLPTIHKEMPAHFGSFRSDLIAINSDICFPP
jgi:hypothetical protein